MRETVNRYRETVQSIGTDLRGAELMPRIVDPDQRREQITDAAARLIARSGLEAATMRAVAAEAGWTTGVITHYFADKHELLRATFHASLRRRRALRPATETATPAQRLQHSLEGALPLDDDRRRHWLVTLACCNQASADRELAAAQRDAYREFRGHIAALVAALDDRSDDERDDTMDDPNAVAEQLIAVADGIAIQALFDPESWPSERQLRALRAGNLSFGV